MATGSTISLAGTRVTYNEEITYTLSNSETSTSKLSHVIEFKDDRGNKIEHKLGLGKTTGTVFFPQDWLYDHPDSDYIGVNCWITTKCSSWEYDESTYAHIELICDNHYDPDVYALIRPVITSVTSEKIDYYDSIKDWPFYVPNYCGIKLYVTGEAKYGATIKRQIWSHDNSIGLSDYYDFGDGTFEFSNVQNCLSNGGYCLDIEDSRYNESYGIPDGSGGFKSRYSIPQVDYNPPSCSSSFIQRCLQDGSISDFGTNCSFSANISFSPCTYNSVQYNTLKSILYYRATGEETWKQVGEYENGSTLVFGDNSLFTDSSYELKLEYSDALEARESYFTLSSAKYSFFIKKGGNAVGLGCATSKDNAVEISSDWKLYHGETDVFKQLVLNHFNILDNSYFVDCVYQGQDICEERKRFFMDRWYLDEKFNGGAYCWASNNNDNDYQAYIDEGCSIHQKVDKKVASLFDSWTPFVETKSGVAKISYDPDSFQVTITGITGGDAWGHIYLKWAAMYPGNLKEAPPYCPKGYSTELKNCERYCYVKRIDNFYIPGVIGDDGRSFECSIQIPTYLKGNVNIASDIYSCDIYTVSGLHEWVYCSAAEGDYLLQGGRLRVVFREDEEACTPNTPAILYDLNGDSYIIFYSDAE